MRRLISAVLGRGLRSRGRGEKGEEQGDLFEQVIDEYEKALSLAEEGEADAARRIQQERFRKELGDNLDSGVVTAVEVLAAHNSCEACTMLSGQVFSVEEALETMPLPHRSCSFEMWPGRPFCRCVYLARTRSS